MYSAALKLSKSETISEEIIQETFTSLWVSKEKLKDVEQPANYLYRILFNKINTYLRKESNHQRIIELAKKHYKTSEATTDNTIMANESQRLIDEAIDKMPPQRKLVYQLSRQQGMNNEEIANKLGISVNTVRTHIAEALQFLREQLKNDASMALIVLLLALSDLSA